jgi:hypothetical protein
MTIPPMPVICEPGIGKPRFATHCATALEIMFAKF